MISTFVDREPELELFEREWAGSGARLIVLYGRRRIGKTRLLLEFIRGREGVFYLAADSTTKQQIEELNETMAEYLKDPLLAQLEITDWNQLFEYFVKNIHEKRTYLVIDEFSYMVRSDKSILSTLQRLWDMKFSNTNIFIVISDSLLGLMSKKVLSQSSPLYGRRSRDFLLLNPSASNPSLTSTIRSAYAAISGSCVIMICVELENKIFMVKLAITKVAVYAGDAYNHEIAPISTRFRC